MDNRLVGGYPGIPAPRGGTVSEFRPWDVSEPFDVAGEVDLVMHLVSSGSPAGSARYPVETSDCGGPGTRSALELAARKNARFVLASADEAGPMYRLAVAGALSDLAAGELLERRLEPVVRRGYEKGRAGTLMRAGKTLATAGAAGAVVGALTRSRAVRAGARLALLAASACTRFGVFHAGMNSAQDPAATVEPQRARMDGRDTTTRPRTTITP